MTFNRDRRRLLEGLSLLLGPGVAIQNAQCAVRGSRTEDKRVRVAIAQRAEVQTLSQVIALNVLREQLGKAVTAATGTDHPIQAMAKLFAKTDVVGIKVNTLAGRHLSSHPEIVSLLAEWLIAAGVAENHLVVWDRSDRELEAAGFRINRSGKGVRCFGTNEDYDWTPREWGQGASCFARLLVSEITALINVGQVKDHDLSGISSGLKNLYGVIHNPNRYHDNCCDPYLAELAAFPLIRDKLRLTVLDGLTAQCHGGPAYSPHWAWPWGGVLVSTDPVAIDAVSYQLIDARRKSVGLKSLVEVGREPKWIASASRLGLGVAALERIAVLTV